MLSWQGLLISCNQMSADYLFQTDKCYDCTYDTGDKVIQCGRHNDIFKLWLQWRARVGRHIRQETGDAVLITIPQGSIGFEKQMDRLMELTYYQVDRIKSMPDKFYLIVPEPECTNVCFWYIPTRLVTINMIRVRKLSIRILLNNMM